MRTFSPKDSDITRQWHVIDATDVVLGRLASHVAVLLRGKHKPIFAPHVDTGDFVIVINADKVALSGTKLRGQEGLPALRLPGRPERGQLRGPDGQAPDAGRREGGQGDAPQELPRPQDARASSRSTRARRTRTRRSSRSRTRSGRFPSSAARKREEEQRGRAHWRRDARRRDGILRPGVRRRRASDGEDAPSEYTTESSEAAAPRAARRPVITGHANGLGRRKEAIARVRIVPGTGQWKINGRHA